MTTGEKKFIISKKKIFRIVNYFTILKFYVFYYLLKFFSYKTFQN